MHKIPHNLLFLAVVVLATVGGLCAAGPMPGLDWSPSPIRLSAKDARAVCRATGAIIRRTSAAPTFPAVVRNDRAMRVVFLTVPVEEKPAVIVQGSGNGLAKAIRDAAGQLPGEARAARMFKLDIVQDTFHIKNFQPKNLLTRRRGTRGFTLDWGARLAWLPEEIVAHNLMHPRGPVWLREFLKHARTGRGDEARLRKLSGAERLEVVRFETTALLYDGRKAHRLYRGHRLWDAVPAADLRTAATLAADYLARAVTESGKFVYDYDAAADRAARGYNMLRHCGSLAAMMEYHERTPNADLLAAAKRGYAYLQKRALPYLPAGDTTACIESASGNVKLGGSALAVLALVRYERATGDKQYRKLAGRFAKYIVISQRKDGSFISKRHRKTGEVVDWNSEYYPGEAVFALAMLYQLDRNDAWLAAARRGAEWLIKVRDREGKVRELIHDHWLLYGLNQLHSIEPQKIYVDHTARIITAIANSQHGIADAPDWLGGWYAPPRSTPASCRNEGLLAAYNLLRHTGKKKEATEAAAVIQGGIGFILQMQLRPEQTLYLPKPDKALGGVRKSYDDHSIRIDYVQHFLSAVLQLEQLLAEKRAAKMDIPKLENLFETRDEIAFPWRE
jgi:hypothetical protein